jgi:hypothetical protein
MYKYFEQTSKGSQLNLELVDLFRNDMEQMTKIAHKIDDQQVTQDTGTNQKT